MQMDSSRILHKSASESINFIHWYERVQLADPHIDSTVIAHAFLLLQL